MHTPASIRGEEPEGGDSEGALEPLSLPPTAPPRQQHQHQQAGTAEKAAPRARCPSASGPQTRSRAGSVASADSGRSKETEASKEGQGAAAAANDPAGVVIPAGPGSQRPPMASKPRSRRRVGRPMPLRASRRSSYHVGSGAGTGAGLVGEVGAGAQLGLGVDPVGGSARRVMSMAAGGGSQRALLGAGPLVGAGDASGDGRGSFSMRQGASGAWEIVPGIEGRVGGSASAGEHDGGMLEEARSLRVSVGALPRARAFLAGMRELAALFGYPFASVDGWWVRERERMERASLFRRLCGDSRLREGRVLTRWTEQALGSNRTCLFHDDQQLAVLGPRLHADGRKGTNQKERAHGGQSHKGGHARSASQKLPRAAALQKQEQDEASKGGRGDSPYGGSTPGTPDASPGLTPASAARGISSASSEQSVASRSPRRVRSEAALSGSGRHRGGLPPASASSSRAKGGVAHGRHKALPPGALPPFDTSDLAVAASKVQVSTHDEAWWKELHARAMEAKKEARRKRSGSAAAGGKKASEDADRDGDSSQEQTAKVPTPPVVKLFVAYLAEELCESYSMDQREELSHALARDIRGRKARGGKQHHSAARAAAVSLDVAEAAATGEIRVASSDVTLSLVVPDGAASPSRLRGVKEGTDDGTLLSKVQPVPTEDPGKMAVGDTLEAMAHELVFTRIIRACCGQVLGADGRPIGPGAADRAHRQRDLWLNSLDAVRQFANAKTAGVDPKFLHPLPGADALPPYAITARLLSTMDASSRGEGSGHPGLMRECLQAAMELLSWEAGRRLKASKETKLRAEAAAEAASRAEAASKAAAEGGCSADESRQAGEAASQSYLEQQEPEIMDRLAQPAALGAEDLLPLLIYAIAIAPADAASIYGGDQARQGVPVHGHGAASSAASVISASSSQQQQRAPPPAHALRDRVQEVGAGAGAAEAGTWTGGAPPEGVDGRPRAPSSVASVLSVSTAGGAGHSSHHHHHHSLGSSTGAVPRSWRPTPSQCQRSLQWRFAHATLQHLANFGVAESEWIGRMGFNIIMVSSSLKWITDYGIEQITKRGARRRLAAVEEGGPGGAGEQAEGGAGSGASHGGADGTIQKSHSTSESDAGSSGARERRRRSMDVGEGVARIEAANAKRAGGDADKAAAAAATVLVEGLDEAQPMEGGD